MEYRTNRMIDPESSYEELLAGLTVGELQDIRKNWDFKGISHLKKARLVEELAARILESLDDWLALITFDLVDLLTELFEQDGFIYLESADEQDLRVFEYLQQRGLAFYGNCQGVLTLVMPEEILELLEVIITTDPYVMRKIEQNSELVLLTIGSLVYYGVYPIIKLPELIDKHLDFELDVLDYFKVINEFRVADGLVDFSSHHMLAIAFLMEPEWVLDEQAKRSSIQYYEMSKRELLYAGENMVPPPNSQHKRLISFLKENKLNKDRIIEIIGSIYVGINNDLPFTRVVSLVMDMAGFNTEKQLRELSKYLQEAYNNTPQWVLKGNTPAMISGIGSRNSVKGNVVNLREYKKYKEDSQGTLHKVKDVGRNDPCPCGSGKKYKKCCLKKEK